MTLRIGLLAAIGLTVTACDRRAPDPEPTPTDTPTTIATASIFAPDAGVATPPVAPMKPLEVSIGFPDGGDELNQAALSRLAEVLKSEQLKRGGTVILRAHSDSAGTDDANMRASQSRGDAVKAYLVERGVSEDRIVVIAFGEQNPAEPNALPDGEPNEAGRAANRRVDITIDVAEDENAEPDGPARTAPPIMDGAD